MSYSDKLYRVNRGVCIHQANWSCEVCETYTTSPEVHHKDFDNTNHRLSNLICVCHECHILIHKGSPDR